MCHTGKRRPARTAYAAAVLGHADLDGLLDWLADKAPQRLTEVQLEVRVELDERAVDADGEALALEVRVRVRAEVRGLLLHGDRRDGARGERGRARRDEARDEADDGRVAQ
jgi:hypothetical protein